MRCRLALLLVAVIACGGMALDRADAATPTLSLRFSATSINAGTSSHIVVTSTGLRGATLTLQRRYGSTYRSVEVIRTLNGTATGPKLRMGRYVFRIVATRGGRKVATSVARTITAYGNVSFSSMCGGSDWITFRYCSSGTAQAGSNTFAYALTDGWGNTAPNGTPLIEATRSTCRNVTVSYAIDNSEATGSDDVTGMGASLTQSGSPLQQSSNATQTIKTSTFSIHSPTWDLETWTNNGKAEVFVNGHASCYTPSGDSQ